MLICMQKINFITQFFLKILQRVIWACLATYTWNDNSNLKKPFTFICRKKIKFILHNFLEVLQRYCKLIVLSNLGMYGYTNAKWYYQLVEKLCVYLQAKNQPHLPCFSGNIAKICKLILGTLGRPGCTHPKW